MDKLVSQTDFFVIASAVLKDKLITQYGPQANNPYDLSLTFVLERTVFLTDRLKCAKVEVIAEARGKNEDSKLHDQYQIILSNIPGTQLCDLIAYPLANYVLYPERENLAFGVTD